MRTKDDQKRKALFEATVKIVNEIGFAASSVSKIAKEADVSPSTLYVFFKNKEDLLVSTYTEIKRDLSQAMLECFDNSLPIRDIMKNAWFGMFEYVTNNQHYYQFMEQFANSPYSELVDTETLEKHFSPMIDVVQRGIEQKIIKNVDHNLLMAFLFQPLTRLANPRLCHNWKLTSKDLEIAFGMAWDAIKL
ncbi:MAG: TetR/AcrR family transcriptional regulator [Desulfobacteraceae bacterium]|jgi:AcrR family transcriptional regulator